VLWSQEDRSIGLQVNETSVEHSSKFGVEAKGMGSKTGDQNAIKTNSNTPFTKSKTVSLK